MRPMILLTNDDGVDSRALLPFARSLSEIGDVRIVVPDRERSWVSKALTGYQELRVNRLEGDIDIVTVSGFPADCVQLGVHNLLGRQPDIVISGINIGANHGMAYVVASGTVGAALEAAIVGVPAMAFSAVSTGEWATWSAWAHSPDSDETWHRLGALATGIAADLLSAGFPEHVDVFKIEMPSDATLETPRRVTKAAPVTYGRLCEQKIGDIYHHRFGGGLHPVGPVEGTDWLLSRDGHIAITPLHIDMTTTVDDDLRARLERS